MRIALLILAGSFFLGCGPAPADDRCAEIYRVCMGALDAQCGADDLFCPSDAPPNQAARTPIAVYCARAYEACQ